MKDLKENDVLINLYSGLKGVVDLIEPETNTIWLILSEGQRSDYDLDTLDTLWRKE
jgi:hypothetical protein